MMKPTAYNCKSCKEQLDKIRALDFALQETVLYLDAYPDCREALEYYHHLLRDRCEAISAYEDTCGPLTMYGNTSRDSWDWTRGPWPWEYEAN